MDKSTIAYLTGMTIGIVDDLIESQNCLTFEEQVLMLENVIIRLFSSISYAIRFECEDETILELIDKGLASLEGSRDASDEAIEHFKNTMKEYDVSLETVKGTTDLMVHMALGIDVRSYPVSFADILRMTAMVDWASEED